MPSHRLQQVAVLVVRLVRRRRIRKDHEADELIHVRQRNDQPQSALRCDRVRRRDVLVRIRGLAQLGEIDHPFVTREQRDHFGIGRQGRVPAQVVLAGWPRRDGPELRSVLGTQEQHATGTVDDLGDRADRILTRLHALFRLGQRADEAQPFDAIVVLVAVEVLAEKNPQPAPQVSRGDQGQQHHARADEEHELRRPPPRAAVEPDQVSAPCHQQQVRADDDERGRVEDDMPRNEDVQRPLRVAPRGNGDHRHHQQHDEAAGIPRGGLDAFYELRLRVQEQVIGEHQANRDDQELEREPPALARVAVDLLEQDEPEQRHDQARVRKHGSRLWRRQPCHGQHRRGKHQSRDDDPHDVHESRELRCDPCRFREPGEHDEPRPVAQHLCQQRDGRRDLRHRRPGREQRRPERGHPASHHEPHALRPSFPAGQQQQREQQETGRREAVGNQARGQHRHRAPFPQRTTSTVCTRIAKSKMRLRFFT